MHRGGGWQDATTQYVVAARPAQRRVASTSHSSKTVGREIRRAVPGARSMPDPAVVALEGGVTQLEGGYLRWRAVGAVGPPFTGPGKRTPRPKPGRVEAMRQLRG
jgi:hypothetical protein